MAGREPFAEHTLSYLLHGTAQRTPSPGGGAGAAWTCAIAAALAAMVASYAAERDVAMEDVADRAGELREHVLALADMDADAYGAYLSAEGAARNQALSAAADPPLLIARAAAEVAALATGAMLAAPKSLVGDARTAVILAEAAAQAASHLVVIDLVSTPKDPRVQEAEACAAAAVSARERAMGPGTT